jgi:hypothetical protein
VNGQVISKAIASGGYNIASCEISQDRSADLVGAGHARP